MKRALLSFLAVASLLTIPLAAHAEWVQKEVRWRISSQGAPWDQSAIYVRDTLRTSIGPVDTTASFSINEAQPVPRGLLAPGIVG